MKSLDKKGKSNFEKLAKLAKPAGQEESGHRVPTVPTMEQMRAHAYLGRPVAEKKKNDLTALLHDEPFDLAKLTDALSEWNRSEGDSSGEMVQIEEIFTPHGTLIAHYFKESKTVRFTYKPKGE